MPPKTKRALPDVMIKSTTKQGQSGKEVRKPFVVINVPKHPQKPTPESDYAMEEDEDVQSEASHPTVPPITPTLRSILYVRGLGRRKIYQVRCLFTKLGIPPRAVQFIQFVGANVAELIVLNSLRGDVMEKLATVNVLRDPTFHPLSPTSFTRAATIEYLGLTEKSEVERSEAAKKAFVTRLDSMLKTIGHHRRGLRSFPSSLKMAVQAGAPIQHFIDPSS